MVVLVSVVVLAVSSIELFQKQGVSRRAGVVADSLLPATPFRAEIPAGYHSINEDRRCCFACMESDL
jgi:hypothetical protein